MGSNKFIFWLALVLGSSCGVFAQPKTEPARLPFEILKLKWEKQAKLPQNFDPSGGGSPGTINDSTGSSRGGSGGGSSSDSSGSTTQGLQPSSPSRITFAYLYSIKIRNRLEKPIEGVAWDYVFLDPANSQELGRHQFLSFQKVEAGKTATFQIEQRTPPVRVFRTQTVAANKHGKLSETAVIRCVLYADGTTWLEANTNADVCGLLRKGKLSLRR